MIHFLLRYISSVYSACFYHIRDTLTLAERIAVALVTKRHVFKKIQRVKNYLSRVGPHALVAPSLY